MVTGNRDCFVNDRVRGSRPDRLQSAFVTQWIEVADGVFQRRSIKRTLTQILNVEGG